MAAIAAIMVAILAAIFNMIAKTHISRTDAQHFHIPPLRFAGVGDNKSGAMH
jgi:hypothetical protein